MIGPQSCFPCFAWTNSFLCVVTGVCLGGTHDGVGRVPSGFSLSWSTWTLQAGIFTAKKEIFRGSHDVNPPQMGDLMLVGLESGWSLIIFVCCAGRPRCRHPSLHPHRPPTQPRAAATRVEQQDLLPCPSRSARSLPIRFQGVCGPRAPQELCSKLPPRVCGEVYLTLP